MGLFSKVSKIFGQGAADVFTGGLDRLPVFNGAFKKVGQGVGKTLTLQNPFSTAPKAMVPIAPATGRTIDTSGDLSKLQQIFAPVQEQQYAAIDADAGDALKRLRASQAARGILRSGISDYPTAEVLKASQAAKGAVRSGLANVLGTTEGQRSLLGTQANIASAQSADDFNRNLDLVKMINEAQKKSKLSQIFEGVTAFSPLLTAAFGPGGAGASYLAQLFGSGAQSPLDLEGKV